MMALTIGSFAIVPQANAGVWDYVCCGTICTGGDACMGSGDYTCCKGGALLY